MKKKILEREITYEENSALKYLEDEKVLEDSDYDNQQHKNEDYQVLIITGGKTRGFIGYNLGEYSCGDIIVIGKNVPHYFILDKEKWEQDNIPNRMEVLHFKHDLFPLKLEEISEFHFVHSLLKMSQQGIVFRDEALFKKIRIMLNRIDDLNGIQKLNELYVILDTLGRNKHYSLISLEEYSPDNNLTSNINTLHRTYNYLYTNFRDDITLDSIAEYAHQNATALCRTFKRETGKTIFQFLNKIRIVNACKLLVETDMSISQVAYESGFTNLPHFNKQFRFIINKTPTEYRDIYGLTNLYWTKS